MLKKSTTRTRNGSQNSSLHGFLQVPVQRNPSPHCSFRYCQDLRSQFAQPCRCCSKEQVLRSTYRRRNWRMAFRERARDVSQWLPSFKLCIYRLTVLICSLYSLFKQVVEMAGKDADPTPVGALTAADRDVWTKVRFSSLQRIERSRS